MQGVIGTLILSLLICSSLQQAAYDQTLAIELMHVSNMAYCPVASLKAGTCGPDCVALQGQVTFLYYNQQTADLGDAVSFSMYKDDSKQMFMTAFRGTNTDWQLFLEGAEGDDVEYSTYDISDAVVTSYFYNRYNTYLRQDYLSQLSSAVSQYPGYTFAFTGHSLGAALTTLAALDAILGGYVSASQAIMYNYGSPRVGNYAFASAVVQNVPVIYRVVHWNDLVPHVPLCVSSSGNCIADSGASSYDESGDHLWPAWHVWPQIFYTEDFSDYQQCSAEASDCMDQFDLIQCSIDAHLDYFGIQVGCHQAEVPSTENSNEASNNGNASQEDSKATTQTQEESKATTQTQEASNDSSNNEATTQDYLEV
jgi:hypothetical protein